MTWEVSLRSGTESITPESVFVGWTVWICSQRVWEIGVLIKEEEMSVGWQQHTWLLGEALRDLPKGVPHSRRLSRIKDAGVATQKRWRPRELLRWGNIGERASVSRGSQTTAYSGSEVSRGQGWFAIFITWGLSYLLLTDVGEVFCDMKSKHSLNG